MTAGEPGDPRLQRRSGGTGPPRPTAVVFDCDGLLADTAAGWDAAFTRAAAELGTVLSADHLMDLRGSSVSTAARTIASWSGTPQAGAWLGPVLHQALREALTITPPRPMSGAAALVRRLQGLRRLAVSSNAPRDVLDATLASTGLLTLVDQVVSADDVAAPKPAPDVYLAACRRLRVNPSRAVALEDSDLGAAAAVAAGLRTVLVTTDDIGSPRVGAGGPTRPAVTLRVRSLDDPLVAALILSEPGTGAVTPQR